MLMTVDREGESERERAEEPILAVFPRPVHHPRFTGRVVWWTPVHRHRMKNM